MLESLLCYVGDFHDFKQLMMIMMIDWLILNEWVASLSWWLIVEILIEWAALFSPQVGFEKYILAQIALRKPS